MQICQQNKRNQLREKKKWTDTIMQLHPRQNPYSFSRRFIELIYERKHINDEAIKMIWLLNYVRSVPNLSSHDAGCTVNKIAATVIAIYENLYAISQPPFATLRFILKVNIQHSCHTSFKRHKNLSCLIIDQFDVNRIAQ